MYFERPWRKLYSRYILVFGISLILITYLFEDYNHFIIIFFFISLMILDVMYKIMSREFFFF